MNFSRRNNLQLLKHAQVIPVFHTTCGRAKTGESTLPRRAYNDLEVEMANKLSTLPDYYAWCRLQRKPEDEAKAPELFEARVKTEQLTKGKACSGIAAYIKKRSQAMAQPRKKVEAEMLNREFKIMIDEATPSAEKRKRN